MRLKKFDYSGRGVYFLTICVKNHQCLFGKIIDGKTKLSDAGKEVEKCWKEIPKHFPNVKIYEFVVMPNHIHGIIEIIHVVGAKKLSPLYVKTNPCGTSKTIGSIIRGFKIGVTKWMRKNTLIHDVWQRNYYERIIRNDKEIDDYRISYVSKLRLVDYIVFLYK